MARGKPQEEESDEISREETELFDALRDPVYTDFELIEDPDTGLLLITVDRSEAEDGSEREALYVRLTPAVVEKLGLGDPSGDEDERPAKRATGKRFGR